jgi:predicted nuclease of predicted toxin-antitoxin system
LKLLIDENLTPSLARKIQDLFPGSVQVRDVGLSSTSDQVIWVHATDNGFALLTKDRDFAA